MELEAYQLTDETGRRRHVLSSTWVVFTVSYGPVNYLSSCYSIAVIFCISQASIDVTRQLMVYSVSPMLLS